MGTHTFHDALRAARADGRRDAPGQRGYALAIVMVFAACLFTVWTSLFAYAQAARKWGDTSEERRQAIWAARAGLVHRAAQIQVGGRGGVAKPPLGGLDYKVKERSEKKEIVITSTAESGDEEAVLQWRVPK